jgi:RNA polymerase sigma-70 factor (ECF subfamily)
MKNFLQDWETQFITHRPYLVAFAFRMTGSLAEAEELVQDTFIECAEVNPAGILNHKSWLTKVCSNKSLDLLKSAYKRRETYIGTWLPDAVPDSYQYWGQLSEGESPDKSLLLSESLTTTFLLMVEKLTPEERVVYILSEVFEYTFKEIGEFLNKTDDSLRKTAQRARNSLLSEKVKFNSSGPESQNLIVKFFEYSKKKDKTELLELLADQSEFWSDGGGKVNAIRVVVRENEQIVRFFTSDYLANIFNSPNLKVETTSVNGLPGLMISTQVPDGTWIFDTIMSFEILGDKIARIYSQRNPDKLKILV